MDSIIVTGGGPLSGQIPIAGAKNACLTLMPATLLSEEPLTLINAPRLSDIRTMTELLRSLGAEVTSLQAGKVLAMSSHDMTNHTAHYDIVRKMRASVCVLAAFLAFFPIAVGTLRGLKSAPAASLELMDSYAASWTTTLFKLRFPAAIPTMVPGVKLGATAAVIGVIVSEISSLASIRQISKTRGSLFNSVSG